MKNTFGSRIIALFSAILLSHAAHAVEGGFGYDGRLTKLDGTPIQDASVQFQVSIVSPGASACVLFVENHTVNMTGSNGNFALQIGDGTRIDSTGSSLVNVFKNSGVLPAQSCSSGSSYTPAAGDIRYLRVTVTPSSTNVAENLTAMPIGAVPSATTLAGYSAGDFAKLGAGQLTQANLNNVFTAANYTTLTDLLAGNYARSSSAAGQTLPSYSGAPSTPVAGSIWYDSVSGNLKMQGSGGIVTLSGSSSGGSGGLSATLASGQIYLGSSGNTATAVTPSGDVTFANNGAVTVNKIKGYPIAATAPTTGKLLRYNGTSWEPQTLALADLPAGVASPWQTNGSNLYYGAGRVGVGTSFPGAALDVSGFGTNSAMLVPRDGMANRPTGVPGMLRYNTDLNIFEGYNSSIWVSLGSPWMSSGPDVAFPSGKVGIGTTAPNSLLEVQGIGYSPLINALNFNASSAGSVQIGRARGYPSGPSAVASADELGSLYFSGYNGSAFAVSAFVRAVAKETFTNASAGTDLVLGTTAIGQSGATPRLLLTGDGRVGIGTMAPAYTLDVNGTVNATDVRVNGVTVSSDLRFKKNVTRIESALAKILNLRGVRYDWRRDQFPEKHFNDRKQMGVIAQEVELEFPEAVDVGVDGYLSVNYPALVSPLIEATRELNSKIESLESENASLKARLDAQTRDLEAIKAHLGL